MMEWDEDIPLAPPARTPKKLQLICAEAIALHLAIKSAPAVDLYFSDPISPYTHYTNMRADYLLKDLITAKKWYWKETKPWLGHSTSTVRALISAAFMDVLIFFASPIPCRERQVFNAFIYQLLFSHFTGSFPTKCCFPVNHLTKNLNTFVNRLGPFELLSMHDSCLIFGDSNPYPVLMKNSPFLKHIFISSNLNSVVLESLRKYCKNIEVIEIEVNAIEPIEEVESILCRTFFEDLDMNELIEKANAGEYVQRSFPELRELYFFSFRDYKIISCTLMFLLQHFYPEIRTRWRCIVRKVNETDYCKCSAKHFPAFVREKKFQFDVMKIQFYVDELQFVSSIQSFPKFLKVNYLEVFPNFLNFYAYPDLLELMKNYKCNNLLLQRFSPINNRVTESLYRVGQNLNQLYLYGNLTLNRHIRRFLRILSACVNLTTLSLELLIKADCECMEFDFQLLKLESVCLVFLHQNYQWHMTPKIWIPREFQITGGDAGIRTTTCLETLNDANNRDNPCTSISPGENESMSGPSNALHQRCSENESYHGHSINPYTYWIFPYENLKLVDAVDIIEEKIGRTSPARNGRSDSVRYEEIVIRNFDDDSGFSDRPYHQYRLNFEEWKYAGELARMKCDFSGPKELAFIFSEICGIHMNFSEGTFRYGQFGFGFYGNGGHGAGYYGYGVDGFGFYGYGVHGYGFYGYGASGFGFYGPSIHTFMMGFHGNGEFGYGCYMTKAERGHAYYPNRKLGYEYYPHPKLSSEEDCSSKNCCYKPFHASRRHALQFITHEYTEQEDIGNADFPEVDMITRLLLSIISKCPNLKTLELPGTRLRDLEWLSHTGYLRKVCTLKISNTFSPEVKRILEGMPSLSLLIIDGLNGMSNFNKYKMFFRWTDLRVEFYDARLIHPSSPILDTEKTRLNL